MRILGFEKKWPKLENDSFTTFRFPRRDKDWEVTELVLIVIKPRSKDREERGVARIVNKVPRRVFPPSSDYIATASLITEEEAIADGFPDVRAMQLWMWDRYKRRLFDEPMNKLTLVWERAFTIGDLIERCLEK